MARCPNCARKVHFWHNHSGYCSKQCRTDSITSCPNCGKVGLYKHARLGCCSEECRYWYVAGLLGYDKEALLTPAWDKIVYHVRLPSTSAEISSLQLDELEYDRAIDTVLVIAAPPWMQKSRVLAELPYDRFDSTAWQHLWADGTLTEDELFRFHRMCYEDDLLCLKIGEHVFAKLRQAPAAAYNGLPPGSAGYVEAPAYPTLTLPQSNASELPQARIAPPEAAPSDFVESVRAIFEDRGYTVAPGTVENTLLLRRNGRTALAMYQHRGGMVDVDPVQRAFTVATNAGATQAYFATSGHFTLQAEDFAAAHPIQLIDGDEMAELAARRQGSPAIASTADETVPLPLQSASPNGKGGATGDDHRERTDHTERTEVVSAVDAPETRGQEAQQPQQRAPHNGSGSFGKMAPIDAEIIGGEGAV